MPSSKRIKYYIFTLKLKEWFLWFSAEWQEIQCLNQDLKHENDVLLLLLLKYILKAFYFQYYYTRKTRVSLSFINLITIFTELQKILQR